MATRRPSQRTSDGRITSATHAQDREALDEELGAARFALEALAIERAVRSSLGLLPATELS
jgi:hypothetical protein